MTMLEYLKELLIAPRANCMGCGNVKGCERDWLCADCYARLAPLYMRNAARAEICAECGETYTGGVCGVCGRRKPETFVAAAPYEYDDVIRAMVREFKFHGVWRMSPWMADEMRRALDNAGIRDFTLITPVPLHFTRRFERGYNQSEKLALELSALTGVRCENVLRRMRATRRQALLSAAERRENLKDVFMALRPLDGETVLLVDDVRTTGTTCVRCAHALKEAGAQNVRIVTFACAVGYTSAFRKYRPDRGTKLQKIEKDPF